MSHLRELGSEVARLCGEQMHTGELVVLRYISATDLTVLLCTLIVVPFCLQKQ